MICRRLAEPAQYMVGLLLLVAVGQVCAADFEVVGTDNHAWFLLPSPETSVEELPWALAHYGVRDDPMVYRPVRRFAQKPTALAALGESFWLTLPPRSKRPDIIPVRVMRIQWNTSIDRYLVAPRTGMDLLPNIETDPNSPASPVDLVATLEGPVVLLEHGPGQYSMQRLRRGRWKAVTLPQGLEGQLLRLGIAHQRLVLLGERDEVLRFYWETGEGWTVPVEHPGLGSLRDLATVGDRLVVATEPEPGKLSLAFVQPDGLARLGTWSEPKVSWRILGTHGQMGLVKDTGELESSRIDPITGNQGPWTSFIPGSPMGMSPWPLLLAVAASIFVMLVLIRGRATTVLAKGLLPLAAIPRLCALFIDAIPGFVVVMLWQDAQPRLLLEAFTLSLDARGWGLYAILVGITCAWSLAWELIMMTSPGKALMGGHLQRVDGERPVWGLVVVRSLIKSLVLMLPILMITALRPPALQSPADQATGIIVAGRGARPGESEPEDGT
ncbi:MAG: RDD family protein [Planctomycetota bacterium]|nr:RDD family protein [Planctomycetota bacterium]